MEWLREKGEKTNNFLQNTTQKSNIEQQKILILSTLKYIRGTWPSNVGLLSDKASYACYGINVFSFHLWHISYCTYSIVNTSCQLIVNHVLDAKEVIGNHKCINRRTDNVMTRRKKGKRQKNVGLWKFGLLRLQEQVEK